MTYLRTYDKPIVNVDQLDEIPYVGKKIKDKVKEFLETGEIKRYAFIAEDEKTQTVDLLQGVWGVGPAMAAKLYAKGIKSIDDLKKN